MNASRLITICVTSCAASLSLAACNAGITSVSPPASHSLAASPAASSSAVAASHPSSPSVSPSASPSSGGTASADALIASFPLPHGTHVLYKMACGKNVLVEVGSVTPSAASSFYTAALPRAGYQITSNISGTNPDGSGSMIQFSFTGHGYQGSILASSDVAAVPSTGSSGLPPISLPSNETKNVVYINLYPPGDELAGPAC